MSDGFMNPGKFVVALVFVVVSLNILFAFSGQILSAAGNSSLELIGGPTGSTILGVVLGAVGLIGSLALLLDSIGIKIEF